MHHFQEMVFLALAAEQYDRDPLADSGYDFSEQLADVHAFLVEMQHHLLADHGCRMTVVPAQTPAAEVLAMNPDGVFLSNGPGDPEPYT
jgi:hypothetical protein